MKTMILAAFAALILGVGSAYAAGGGGAPAGWEPPVYGAQAFSDHRNQPVVHFLGKDTVFGKLFNHSDDQVAAAATSAKGG
jgi:hypothetical protein